MASQPGYFNVQEFSDAGVPLVLGRLYTYAYGTTTQKVAYTDAAGLVPHTYTLDASDVPYIALNARGELAAPLYLLSGSYDLALKRADGSTVWTRRADGQSNTADLLRAELAASSGGSLVRVLAPFGTAVARTLSDIEGASTLDVATPRDGTTLADVAFAKLALECDTGKARWWKLENWNTDYRISTPVGFTNPGVRIHGEQGATYNRSDIKKGWIEAATGTTHMFDLGLSRTTGNPADNWTMEGLSLRQATGVTTQTVDGVRFTMRLNGPDRGATLRDMSFVGLKDAITVENPDLETVLASLNVEGCVFQSCLSAINAKGNLLGLRFVGNQCEQNTATNGVFRGSINGAITITDNMLEGQPNVLSIEIPPVTGNIPKLLFARNYTEGNSGNYVVRLRCTSTESVAEIGPNYGVTITASDYVLIEESGAWTITMRDPFPIVFKNSRTLVRYGSEIFSGSVRSFGIRQLMPSGANPVVVTKNYSGLRDVSSSCTHASPTSGGTAMTSFGTRYVVPVDTFLNIPIVVAVGDLVAVHIACYLKMTSGSGSLVFQAYDTATTSLVHEQGEAPAYDLNGREALVTYMFKALVASSSLNVRFFNASGTHVTAILGAAAQNFGAFANDGVSKVSVEPVCPNLS